MYGMNYGFNQYQQPQNVDERIWVQNQNAAEAYLVAPSSFVRLWDSQKPMFYEKRADATGRPLALDIYKYEKIEPQQTIQPQVNNELTEQLKSLNERVLALEKELMSYESN